MAEGFARTLGIGKISVASAGLEASEVNPHAIHTMQTVGIDIRTQTSNALAEFSPADFDGVISLCGCGVNLPAPWLSLEIFEDWQLDDPAEAPEIFPRVREEIRSRVLALLDRLDPTTLRSE